MDTLFKDEEFDNNTGNKQEPVTVLGLTFASDEDRRDYFREELRKKLPELKLIEGFPIGEDDDIVNLSDPPYYTACPNPWINDFITEWENEKETLEKQGQRVADFVVDEPYASDVSEGKNNPIYMAHAYHTKVPHPAIMRYILHYTQPGDIVFDGFAGTGMTGVAAQLCGSDIEVAKLKVKDVNVGVRRGICSDLSPIATLIGACYTQKYDSETFRKKANAILDQVEKELGWMYETNVNGQIGKINTVIWSDVFICSNCTNEITFWNEAVNLENNSIRDSFACPKCGTKCSKKNMSRAVQSIYDPLIDQVCEVAKKVPVKLNFTLNKKRLETSVTNLDLDILAKINTVSCRTQTYRMPLGDESRRNDKIGITHTHQFYTYRCFLYLSRINELVCGDIFLKAWLTSACISTTKMNRFRFSGTGVNSGTLYIPSLNWEFNPRNTLQKKIQSFVDIHYSQRGNVNMSVTSATNLSEISDNTIDYIFTDPPFGANIMYSELSSIWEGWLSVITNNKDEAIVNKTQRKNLFDYQQLMSCSLKEFFRILKPGKWITIEFSNTSASVWNSIQSALQTAGFIVANVSALDKKQGTFKTVNTTTAVKQDLVITCFKPSSEFVKKISLGSISGGIWDFVEELLSHLPIHVKVDNATTAIIERSPKILYDRLIAFYVQRSLPVPIDAGEFQKGLKERFLERDGMYFTGVQKVEYDEKKRGTTEFYHASLFVSSEQDGIMWIKDQLKDTPHTYQELQPKWMQAIAGLRKGDILPELRDLLQENFLQDKVGAWYLPDLENEIDLEKIRMSRLLKLFGVYQELASKPKAKIREIRVEALRAGFKQCYKDKDFLAIVTLAEKIPNNLLMEDEVLLQYYDIANTRVER